MRLDGEVVVSSVANSRSLWDVSSSSSSSSSSSPVRADMEDISVWEAEASVRETGSNSMSIRFSLVSGSVSSRITTSSDMPPLLILVEVTLVLSLPDISA